MKRKIVYIILISMLSFNLYADLKINEDCATQFQPVLNSNNNEKITSFILNSVHLSNKEYAEALIPTLIRNEEFAFKYGARFSKECLSSGLTINNVVTKMLLLDEL